MEERLLRLEEALARMPRRQREIFRAHRLGDMSYEKIARFTGLSTAEVERHIGKAIYELSRAMDGRPLRWWERWFWRGEVGGRLDGIGSSAPRLALQQAAQALGSNFHNAHRS